MECLVATIPCTVTVMLFEQASGLRLFFVQAVQVVGRFELVGTVGRHFRFSATVAG